MKKKAVFFLLILMFPAIHFAAAPQVLLWTENTLLDTLTVSYENLDAQMKTSQSSYSPKAWDALNSFFSDKRNTVMDQKLSLHPKLLNAGQIVDSGTLSSTTYWKIIQAVSIPELNMAVTFSLIVIKNKNSPFLIESVNMLNSVY